jgi:hypothetical protein
MKDKSEQDAKQPKKPYSKPEVRQVPLRPEEAVLGACKSPSASGVGQGGSCDAVFTCNILGS